MEECAYCGENVQIMKNSAEQHEEENHNDIWFYVANKDYLCSKTVGTKKISRRRCNYCFIEFQFGDKHMESHPEWNKLTSISGKNKYIEIEPVCRICGYGYGFDYPSVQDNIDHVVQQHGWTQCRDCDKVFPPHLANLVGACKKNRAI